MALLQPNTKVVFLESPGSLTFEVQDVPRAAAAARAAGAVSMIDNTWSAGFYLQPLTLGVDISFQAATKYIVGHSDVMLGLITTNEDTYVRVKRASSLLGVAAGPDDCYLALRGLRTLSVRLARHQQTALEIARWLENRPEVARVLHPALPNCPGHEIWKRDFTGSNGLLSLVLEDYPKEAVTAMLDGMGLFAMGYSWGGYESLIIPFQPCTARSATQWQGPGPCLRLHCGLEEASDLLEDLEKGFERLNAGR